MASAKARKLKVYQAPFGFYDSVVAAPNQAAALRAWGSRQNLFAEGVARLADDPQAIEAALAQPETPLRRAIGTNAPFELEPRAKPKAPKLSKGEKRPGKPLKREVPPAPPPPDRSKLDEAETSLHRLDDDWNRQKAELARRRAELDAEEDAAEKSYRQDRNLRSGAVETARRAYRAAGGKD